MGNIGNTHLMGYSPYGRQLIGDDLEWVPNYTLPSILFWEDDCYQTQFSLFFLVHFWPNFLYFPYHSFLCCVYLMFFFVLISHHAHKQDDKDTIWLVLYRSIDFQHQLLDRHMIYLVTETPKQSHSSSTWSCAGTSSAVLAYSHNSKFWTPRTWSASRSVSTAQRPQLIARFLISTAARSP